MNLAGIRNILSAATLAKEDAVVRGLVERAALDEKRGALFQKQRLN